MKRYIWSLVVAILLAMILPSVEAQEFRSTIAGQVLDSQSASVQSATVTATNEATGAKFTTRSGDAGEFTLPFVPPGAYTVTVEADRFKKYERVGLAITANQRISLPIVLEIGASSSTVTVTAAAPLLEVDSASVGQEISGTLAAELPLSGRTPAALARNVVSVVDLMNPGWARPFDNGSVASNSMGGGRTMSNELLMDGSPIMYTDGTANRAMAYSPPLASVEEVHVDVFQSNAVYGDTSGGTVNVVTKGGTNQFHGSAEEYNQPGKIGATPFFYKRAGLPNPQIHWNQWSLTAGGPVIIPKVFNGSNKIFWYFAYEGIKNTLPTATVPTTFTVPTAAERTGDFSALLSLGSKYQIYDPASGVLQGGRVQRQAITGNVISAGRLSPLAQKVLANFYPLPNQTGTADGQNNYIASPHDVNNYYNFFGRSDINLSSNHKLTFSVRNSHRQEDLNKLFPTNDGTGIIRTRDDWGVIVDDVYGFTPTMFLNTRVAWNRFVDADTPLSAGFSAPSLGLPATIQTSSTRPELPWFTFGDSTQSLGGTGSGTAAGFRTPFDTEQIFSALSKVVSRHSLTLGVDVRRLSESSISYGNASGQFIFGSNWTVGPFGNSASAPYGQDLAAFLLGMPTDGGYDINSSRLNQSWYSAYFVQDDWHVSSNLTVNLGLRYEHETPTSESSNRTENGFDFTSTNSITAGAKAAYAGSPTSLLSASKFNPVGGPLFASSSNRNIYSTQKNGWSPRVGVAYKLGRTALRAGVGMFDQPYGTVGVLQAGFNQRTPFVASQDAYLTPLATLSNPFPSGILRPIGAAGGLDTNLGKTLTFFNPHLKQPYTARWTFNVQRELAANLLLEVGYIGSSSHNLTLTSNQNLNTVPRQYLSTSSSRDQATINALTAIVANPFQGLLPGSALNGGTTTVQQLLLPFPQYNGEGSLAEQNANLGSSNYNALDIRIEKRLSHGAQVVASYSFSKDLAAVTFLNPTDPKPEYMPATEDRPQRLVVSGSVELPFGRGKAFLGGANRWVNAVVGGWQFSAVPLWQVGAALTWGNVIYNGGPINLQTGNIAKAIDTTQFNTSPSQQLQYNIRSFPTRSGKWRGASQKNLDVSLRKNFRIGERIRSQFVCDVFNVSNHVQFSPPNLNPTSGTFGTITGQDNRPRAIQFAFRLMW